MSIITFRQSKREFTEAAGSLYQREVLAYLISLNSSFKFIRSRLLFYKKHNPKIRIRQFDSLFKFFNNIKLPNSEYESVTVLNKKLIKKDKKIYNIPFHISEKIIANLSVKRRDYLIKKFRKQFWNNNKKIKQRKNSFNIVLHIRNKSKGDVIKGDSSLPYQLFSHDYKLPNNNPIFYKNWYLAVVNKILRENPRFKNATVYICSTGRNSDFKDLFFELSKICKIKKIINIDEFETFKIMINADHLVLAQSSFSYLASLINNKKKYIRNGFRHPLPSDIQILNDYSFLDISYSYYIYCKFLEGLIFFKLFLKNTDFLQIIKNRFKFF